MPGTSKKISNFVSSQVPGFVRDDHPNFVAFLEAYYEYLEQSNNTISLGKTVDRAKNLLDYADIDNTLDAFAEKLYKEFLQYFPKEAQANKKTILKNIKDFYRAKGSEKSFNFLFRTLYGKDVSFYYPKDDILRPSTSKWFIEKSVRITNITIDDVSTTSITDLEKFKNTKITGQDSAATAFIERVQISFKEGVQINELFLSNQIGTFDGSEIVTATNLDDETLEATIISGFLTNIIVTVPGTSYNIGDSVTITSNTGTDAVAFVSLVSTGNIANVVPVKGGAGFKIGDFIQFTGGDGSGANANVFSIMGTANNFFHANTINLNSDLIANFSSVTLNTANFGFVGIANSNANSTLTQALSYFTYGPIGPIDETIGAAAVNMISRGNNYVTIPTVDVYGNTRIKNLGVLGRMNVNSGGTGYANGDILIFTNVPGGYGHGSSGNVRSVGANGTIKSVQFVGVSGQILGGSGYTPDKLPTVSVVSSNGVNANISVIALLAYGSPLTEFSVTTGSIGAIEKITISNQGKNYTDATINLSGSGDGTAQATANIVSGTFTYPGRFLDDTGFPSSFNFLQDRDYYQNYAYELIVKESINTYRKYINDLVHPSGMKLWSRYPFISPIVSNVSVETSNVFIRTSTYTANATLFDGDFDYLLKENNIVTTQIILPFANVLLNAASYGFPLNPTANANTTLEDSLIFTIITSEIILPYANVTLNAAGYGFPGNPTANANTTLDDSEAFDAPDISDSKTGTFSVWFNPLTLPASANDERIIFTSSADKLEPDSTANTITFGVSLRSTGVANTSNVFVKFIAKDVVGNTVLDMRSNVATQIVSNVWTHVVASWNIANTQQRHLYISDLSSMNVISYVNDVIHYATKNNTVGATETGTLKFHGGLADLWFTNTYIDLANTTNRHKFITEFMLPVNLGANGYLVTGEEPAYFLYGSANNFAINFGRGDDFTVYGSLEATSSPSDV